MIFINNKIKLLILVVILIIFIPIIYHLYEEAISQKELFGPRLISIFLIVMIVVLDMRALIYLILEVISEFKVSRIYLWTKNLHLK